MNYGIGTQVWLHEKNQASIFCPCKWEDIGKGQGGVLGQKCDEGYDNTGHFEGGDLFNMHTINEDSHASRLQ